MSPASLRARASRLRGARALFTTRHGGVSTGDWASLNLAQHVGDRAEDVERNRARVEEIMGVPVVYVDQVHSPDVLVIDERASIERLRDAPVRADALVTARDDLALAIMVADCRPVLLVDAEAGVVGAAHAGRNGLLDGVLQNTVAAMEGIGARPDRIRAEIGPGVCGACYEVPAVMREESEARLAGVAAQTSWGTPSLDLRAGAVRALTLAGVPERLIVSDAPCTLEDPDYFSYRRSSTTGRFAGVIRRG